MQKYRVRDELPDSAHAALSEYPVLIRTLLFHRGIESAKDAEQFLHPDYEAHLHDPFLLPGMEKAVERVLRAIEKKETIAVYSDYDCDGIPGGVIFHDFFKAIGHGQFINYIPHRHAEGYGLNNQAIDTLHEQGAELMITVDCGITDVSEVKHANTLGIDIIITDHHLPAPQSGAARQAGEPNGELPNAYAILNPKCARGAYPFDGLCGSAVAFKLLSALLSRGNFDLKAGREKWWLDMVGLATCADMVPLRDENRVLARFGLTVLRKSRRPGIRALCKTMRVSQRDITEDDIGFMIAPRINAASRMDAPMAAFDLLTTEDAERAAELAEHLNHINNERKGMVAGMVRDIKKRVRALGKMRPVLVMGNPAWRPALLGLAANTLAEEYRRPVFLWGREGGEMIKGSCRSDGHVNIVELMNGASALFSDFGGHAFSGGFSMPQENIHVLEPELVGAYEKMRTEEQDDGAVYADARLSIGDVAKQTYGEIERLAPFGEGNPKPLFLFENVLLKKRNWFGKENQHLTLSLGDEKGNTAEAVSFFARDTDLARTLEDVSEGKPLSIAAHIEKSVWNGHTSIRLRLIDVLR